MDGWIQYGSIYLEAEVNEMLHFANRIRMVEVSHDNQPQVRPHRFRRKCRMPKPEYYITVSVYIR